MTFFSYYVNLLTTQLYIFFKLKIITKTVFWLDKTGIHNIEYRYFSANGITYITSIFSNIQFSMIWVHFIWNETPSYFYDQIKLLNMTFYLCLFNIKSNTNKLCRNHFLCGWNIEVHHRWVGIISLWWS